MQTFNQWFAALTNKSRYAVETDVLRYCSGCGETTARPPFIWLYQA